jgi:hypothetical protein
MLGGTVVLPQTEERELDGGSVYNNEGREAQLIRASGLLY